jgi:hypothetical protein
MNMNPTICRFIIALNLLVAGQALAEVDYKPINQAATNFLSAMDMLAKQVPAIADEAGTAKALDTWTQANLAFCDAANAFARKYPEIVKLEEPPAEFMAAFSALSQLKTKYAILPKTIGELLQKFGEDEKVRASLKKFQQSLVSLDNLGTETREENKDPSGDSKKGDTK